MMSKRILLILGRSLKSLERNIPCRVGIEPVHETLIGT